MSRRTLRRGAMVILLAGAAVAPSAAGSAQSVDACDGCETIDALVERLRLREDTIAARNRPGWAPPRRIVMIGGEDWAGRVAPAVPGVEVIGVDGPPAALPHLADADVWIGPCSNAVLRAAPKLRWIQLHSAGAESCRGLPALAERGIVVTNMQATFGPQIAETAIAMILSFARGLASYRVQQMAGAWDHEPADLPATLAQGMWELDGKVMLVVGLGGIGTEVAKRASALGMRVTATRNSSREGPDFVEYVGLAHEAVELASRADVVVNAAPLTPATRGMYDRAFFEAMKPTAYFVNVARGGSVVTDDLVAALEAGSIAGAGLDVTDPEPLPPGHPLWSMPNVILTPHASWASDHAFRRVFMIMRENARRYAAGEPLLSVIDPERGY